MTAAPPAHAATISAGDLAAGADSHETEDWHTIEWAKAQCIVRRLQARIVQATQAGRWNKVKALYRS
jgi:RNA-directed DNA polymerase